MVSSSSKSVPLYVLYGSQTGNSEQHAKDFCGFIQEQAKQLNCPYKLETHHSQLDDFLELDHADFVKSGALLVIIVSSYGVGHAPLGAYRFRDLCEHWWENPKLASNSLSGLQYAICGLGDSMYSTFFHNPTTIDGGLTAAGAQRIGDIGVADASKTGDDAQENVVHRWRKSIVKPLLDAIPSARDVTKDQLRNMQQSTLKVLVKLDPHEFVPPPDIFVSLDARSKKDGDLTWLYLGLAVLMALLAIYM